MDQADIRSGSRDKAGMQMRLVRAWKRGKGVTGVWGGGWQQQHAGGGWLVFLSWASRQLGL